jgi:energy-coupling factor transport system substrate-specific component
MITAGWVGQSAGLLRMALKRLNLKGKPIEIIILAIFGALWGLLFGAIMNLWFWPFLGGAPGQTWFQGATLAENMGRYLTYYLATSVIWDVTRAIGNVLIMIFFGRPILDIFDRFNQRFSFNVLPEGDLK